MVARCFFLGILFLCSFFLFLPAQQFIECADSVGIDYAYELQYMGMGGGAAVLDFDQDGYEDVYITGGMRTDALYHNNGNGTFTNVALSAGIGITDSVLTTGAVAGDIDNDGYPDLFITTRSFSLDSNTYAPNILFHNNGNGTFSDISAASGIIVDSAWSMSACFGDYNLDGYLDVYVGNYFKEPFFDLLWSGSIPTKQFSGATDFLYLNDGNQGFVRASHTGGEDVGTALANVFTDYDDDGDLDIYIGNDYGRYKKRNTLFRNRYPNDAFEEVSSGSGMDQRATSMGIAIGDYDGDGLLDYYVTNIRQNILYRNTGTGFFEEQTAAAGVLNDSVWVDTVMNRTISWSTVFFDYDHDMDMDLFICNGASVPTLGWGGANTNTLYRNDGNGTFSDVSAVGDLANKYMAKGSAVFDYDNDGDLDLLVVNQKFNGFIPPGDKPDVLFFRNDNASGKWLKVRLRGVNCNREGIGSRIRVYAGGKTLIREVEGGSGFLSNNSHIAHFGLGSHVAIDSLVVTWPGGCRQKLGSILTNQEITIVEDTQQYHFGLPDKVLLCAGESVQLGKSLGNINYQWSNGATDSVITVAPYTSQLLSVDLIGPGLACSDEVQLVVSPVAVQANPGDSIMPGDTLQLNAVVPYFWDFEDSMQGWTTGIITETNDGYLSGPSTWGLFDSTAGTNGQPFSSLAAGVPNIGDMGPENSYLLSPPMDLDHQWITVEFDSYWSNETDELGKKDAEYVEISVDGGQNWTPLHLWGLVPELHDTVNERQWKHVKFSTAGGGTGLPTHIRFRYDTQDSFPDPQWTSKAGMSIMSPLWAARKC